MKESLENMKKTRISGKGKYKKTESWKSHKKFSSHKNFSTTFFLTRGKENQYFIQIFIDLAFNLSFIKILSKLMKSWKLEHA